MARWHFGALVAALGFLIATASPASAQSAWLTVTNCEIVTIDGHEYGKLTFDIHNVFMHFNQPIIGISLRPMSAPADTCHIVQTTLPAGWTLVAGDQPGTWLWLNTSGFVETGQSIVGVQLVLSQPVCCYSFSIHGALLLDDPTVYACLACPGVTPAGESTWGRIKQTYR